MAIPVALGVIGLDAYFLNYPTQCFFSNTCSSYYYSYDNTYSYDTYSGLSDNSTLYSIRLPLVRAQLATGVLMFVSCVVFIIIFVIVNHSVQKDLAHRIGPSPPIVMVPPSYQLNPPYPDRAYHTLRGGHTMVPTPVIPTVIPRETPSVNPVILNSDTKRKSLCQCWQQFNGS